MLFEAGNVSLEGILSTILSFFNLLMQSGNYKPKENEGDEIIQDSD